MTRAQATGYLLALLVLACLSVTASADEVAYSDIDHAILELHIDSSFNLRQDGSRPSVSQATVNLELFPANDYRQNILALDTKGAPENDRIIFTYEKPPLGEHPFGYAATVNISNQFRPVSRKIGFPLDEMYPYREEYTQPTTYIDFDHAEAVRKQAQTIIEGEDDLYVVVYKLAKWITDNIEYNLSTADTIEKASTTLETRKGVCDEATILFISFARSLGIPTKYISGLAYTNLDDINNWGAHAWAEVYFDGYGWIPFDFTYRQYGFIDASHIKLKESQDANEPAVRYAWTGINTRIITSPLSMTATPISTAGDKENPLLLSIRPLYSSIGKGGHNLIEVTVKNLKNNYFTTSVHLSKAPEVIGSNEQVVLLKPLEEQKLYWIVNVSDRIPLHQYLIYTIEATSLHVTAQSNFTVREGDLKKTHREIEEDRALLVREMQSGKSQTISFFCSHDPSFYLYEPIIIDCSIENGGERQDGLHLCLAQDCETIMLANGEHYERTYTFKEEHAGNYGPKVTLQNKDIFKAIPLEYRVIPAPAITIGIKTTPSEIDYDTWYTVQFRVNQTQTPRNVNITFAVADYEKTWHVDTLDAAREYKLTLKADNLHQGENPFLITATYEDTNAVSYEERLEETIIVRPFNIFQRIKYYLVIFVKALQRAIA